MEINIKVVMNGYIVSLKEATVDCSYDVNVFTIHKYRADAQAELFNHLLDILGNGGKYSEKIVKVSVVPGSSYIPSERETSPAQASATPFKPDLPDNARIVFDRLGIKLKGDK